MKIAVLPNDVPFQPGIATRLALFEPPGAGTTGSVGTGILKEFVDAVGRTAATRAWDLTAVAMAAIAADRHINRAATSEDGWTRMIEVTVAVSDPALWIGLRLLVERMLSFLTGDVWSVSFVSGGLQPPPPKNPVGARPETCISLLSGGLDSLIGALDLRSVGQTPLYVSNRVKGDCSRQSAFAKAVGAENRLVALNHNARTGTSSPEISQRPRSLAFIAFGVLAATTLDRYRAGEIVKLFVPENGFISLNVPLTRLRAGSLSTRTTHPIFMRDMQSLLNGLDLRVQLENPYQFKTKGEMMAECADQTQLAYLAPLSMSCGRSGRSYKHCGRCLPCLVRRAAFFHHGGNLVFDTTPYSRPSVVGVFTEPGFRRYDDVMQCLEAMDIVARLGARKWIGSAITAGRISNPQPYRDVAIRGLFEIQKFFSGAGVI
jgi:7-cyano-7-deazaguanine synthase in queuosine biosynthesis